MVQKTKKDILIDKLQELLKLSDLSNHEIYKLKICVLEEILNHVILLKDNKLN